MKLLLDECLPVDFRHHLPGYEVHTVEWAGFKGLKNGKLLRNAEDAGYDLFLTTDQSIPHQQNLERKSGKRFMCIKKVIDKSVLGITYLTK